MKKVVRSLALLGLVGFLGYGLEATSLAQSNVAKRAIITGGKSYTDFNTIDDVIEAGNDLNEEIAGEGVVLLKNNNSQLPYTGVKRLSVFGKGSRTNYVYGGTGSGASSSIGREDLYDSLEDAGFECNPVLKSFYDDDTRSGTGRDGGDIFGSHGNTIGETPIADYDRSIDESTHIYDDAAIVVISRAGGEGYDNERYNAVDFRGDEAKDGYVQSNYLELSKNEKDMIDYVEKRFSNITVLINSASAMELGTLQDDDKIGSILWISNPGNSGSMAIGRILKGEINPSGRLVDIYARDFTKDPTWQNFGNNNQTNNGTANCIAIGADGKPIKGFSKYGLFGSFYDATQLYYTQYEEGIYVGYRYYETRGHEEGEEWYKNNVVYPFGYGLSYTSFTQEIIGQEPAANNAIIDKDGDIKVTVRVKNTGSVAGKDVVQLYYSAPYTANGIEKSYVNLGAFSKTKLLRPGQSEDVSLTIHVQDMASYDYKKVGEKTGYQLDAGNYSIKLMNNSHDVIDEVTYNLPETIEYTTDRVTGNTVDNIFTDENTGWCSMPHSDDMKQTTLSRSDFEGTFPKHPDAANDTEDRVKSTSTLSHRLNHVFTLDDITEDDPRYVPDSAMTGLTQVPESTADADRTHTLMFKDMVDVPYGDAKWDTLVNELKFSEMQSLVTTGLYHIGGIDSIGKPQAVESDGPSCINVVSYASETMLAATFNTDLVEKEGQMMGNEALFVGKAGWYAPAMNLHRSPFGGRNFEYYSEDPLLSGKMAAAAVRGVQSKGVYAFPKHFAVNEQETDREGLVVFANEQTLRELYFKAFQIMVQEGKPLALMSSFSVLGDCDCASNYGMLTKMLRNEWGFEGKVTTDGFTGKGNSAYQNMNRMYMSGGDYPLGDQPISDMYGHWDDTQKNIVYTSSDNTTKTSTSYWKAIRECVKHILYTDVHSLATNNLLDTSVFKGAALKAAKDISFSQSIACDTSKLGTANVRYEVTSGKLPDGLTLSEKGVISGKATEFGTFAFDITMYGDNWVKNTQSFTIEVTSAFNYTGSDMSTAVVGTPFQGKISSDVLVATEAPDTHKSYGPEYEVSSGSLPLGLTLAEDGTLSGVPLEAGTYNFTVACTTYTYSLNFYTTPWSYIPVPTINYVDYSIVVSPTPYEVSFDANYDGGTKTTVSVLDGHTVTRPADPVREGYIFTGWFTDSRCTKAVDFNTAISADTTFYAGWSKVADTSALEDKVTSLEKKIEDLKTKLDTKADKDSGGCGGSVIAASTTVGALALLGIGLAFKKRREDK